MAADRSRSCGRRDRLPRRRDRAKQRRVSGNTLSIVVVKTNPGYSPEPLNHGTGVIVTKFC